MEDAYNELSVLWNRDQKYHVMQAMTILKSVSIYAEYNQEKGIDCASVVNQQLRQYVQQVRQHHEFYSKEISTILVGMVLKMRTPLLDCGIVRQLKLPEVGPSGLKFAAHQINIMLRSLRINKDSSDPYDYQKPDNCMQEAMIDFNKQLAIAYQINSSKADISDSLIVKLERAIRQLNDRVKKGKCYDINYYLTTIAFRFAHFADEPLKANETKKVRWNAFFFNVNPIEYLDAQYLSYIYRIVSSEIARTSTDKCSFNRLLIIRRDLDRFIVAMKKCSGTNKSCIETAISQLRQLWINERAFIVKYKCNERRYAHIVDTGEWVMDFTDTKLMEVARGFVKISFVGKPNLDEHYHKLISVMPVNGQADNEYINECTLPIAKDLLAYLEKSEKSDAMRLCLKNETGGNQEYFDVMIAHYQRFVAWIEYRTIECRRGKFHLIVNQFSTSLRLGHDQMVKSLEYLQDAIDLSRSHKPRN